MTSTRILSAAKPSGTVIVCAPSGKEYEADTAMCVHCGTHWEVVAGSGRKRGYCMKCMGVTCGQHKCDACDPYIRRFELGLPL